MPWLIAGLGNPGPEYANDRHNIGFMVLDELCRRWKLGDDPLRAKFGSEMASADVAGERVYLQKPMEFMNVSGRAVQRAAAFYQIPIGNIVVIHDDLDLPLGALRVKVSGGHGGHNGLRSLSQTLGNDYLRVRCGIGRPSGGKEHVVGHVLGPFSKVEQKELPFLLGQAADAVEGILHKGATYAMNKFNVSPKPGG